MLFIAIVDDLHATKSKIHPRLGLVQVFLESREDKLIVEKENVQVLRSHKTVFAAESNDCFFI